MTELAYCPPALVAETAVNAAITAELATTRNGLTRAYSKTRLIRTPWIPCSNSLQTMTGKEWSRYRTNRIALPGRYRLAFYRVTARLAAAGPAIRGKHALCAPGITTFLLNGGTLENAQLIAAHESPRTTKLYDRTNDEITLDEVERIRI